MGIPESKDKEKGTESIYKAIMAEKIPNLRREMDIQIDPWGPKNPNLVEPEQAYTETHCN